MAEKRKYYRTRLPSPGELSACLIFQGKEYPGRITDVSASGMGLRFDGQLDPGCNTGEPVSLRLTSPHLNGPLSVPSQVVHIRDGRAGQIYGFGFLDWLGLRSALPPELTAIFNQRGEYRVEPDPDQPIEVLASGIDVYFEVQAQLRDISPAGMSFRAPSLVECVLRKSRHINISFLLPGESDPLTFVARICHRDLAGGHINYGLFFVEEDTENIAEKREVVLRYITERRREGLEQKVP